MKTATLGLFHSRIDAEGAINELRSMGITDTSISYVSLNNEGDAVTRDGAGETLAKGAGTGATTGLVIGGIAGLVVANGLLPGLGTLFVAGPLAAALGLTGAAATATAGAMTGAVAGGLIGGLTSLGVTSDDATRYEERVKEGDILVSAQIDQSSNDLVVKDTFVKFNADEVREYIATA